jgi:hydrogenase maturation protein HypF
MRAFAMCPACRDEYDDPRDRRFHAQPNACPQCGPHLEWWDPSGRVLAAREEALQAAVHAILEGAIVAVKGLGGFHLVADARNDEAVRTLRARKHREEKPFALMYPSMEVIAQHCEVSALEERLLRSPEAPIVLLRRRRGTVVADAVAPRNPYLGIMLPYTPLHHLLLREFGMPLVATSGNVSDEPICTDEREALARLAGLADYFLVHDRPIARPVDDSVVRVMLERELVLRRARGYAPLLVPLRACVDASRRASAGSVLAVGAHLKNTVAVSVGSGAVLSQHLGDLDTVQAHHAFEEAISSLTRLHDVQPARIACDLHPDYRSTRYARASGVPVVAVQHHEAHVRSCMAEHQVEPPVLGVAWDGTGYGLDGTIWGGEFLRITEQGCVRVAHLRRFRLPGGDLAVKEPRRSALGLLHELFGEAAWTHTELAPLQACSPRERQVMKTMLTRGLNAPWTSSAGRLFDAVASLIGLRQVTRFEGQAAMELEYAAEAAGTEEAYACPLLKMALDWGELVRGILRDLSEGVRAEVIAAKFHHALAEGIVAVAAHVGERRVVLSGGCFQNRLLTEQAVQRLRAEGFDPVWHQRVPPNDGGIALGQLAAAVAPPAAVAACA